MKNVTINLYEFNELSFNAQQRAIDEHRAFMLDTICLDDFISGDPEYDTPEKLEEAYNSEYDYIDENDEPVIESIEVNEYLFYANGGMANCAHNHVVNDEIISIVKIGGEKYKIFEKTY